MLGAGRPGKARAFKDPRSNGLDMTFYPTTDDRWRHRVIWSKCLVCRFVKSTVDELVQHDNGIPYSVTIYQQNINKLSTTHQQIINMTSYRNKQRPPNRMHLLHLSPTRLLINRLFKKNSTKYQQNINKTLTDAQQNFNVMYEKTSTDQQQNINSLSTKLRTWPQGRCRAFLTIVWWISCFDDVTPSRTFGTRRPRAWDSMSYFCAGSHIRAY